MTGGTSSRTRGAGTLAWTAGAALLLLAVMVRFGVTRPVDELVRQWARPDDVWGQLQVKADVIVEGLRPTSTLLLTAGIVVAIGLIRRSARPLLVAGATGLLMVAMTVGLKLLVHRPDPHGALSDHGGSFPSGHTVTLVVCTGLVTMMSVPDRYRWWSWVTAPLLGSLMAVALLLQAAHWMTDVVAGGLAGVVILASVTALGADRWCRGAGRATALGELRAGRARPRVVGGRQDVGLTATREDR